MVFCAGHRTLPYHSPCPSSCISSFTSVNKDDINVFVGRKEMSFVLIELETGRIKATLNAECPFIPDEHQDPKIDLDDLEGSKPPISAPTEVDIGGTGEPCFLFFLVEHTDVQRPWHSVGLVHRLL